MHATHTQTAMCTNPQPNHPPSGLSNLHELRVLNLAGNKISSIDVDSLRGLRQTPLTVHSPHTVHTFPRRTADSMYTVCFVTGLRSLAELNLRRNLLTSVAGVETLPALQARSRAISHDLP